MVAEHFALWITLHQLKIKTFFLVTIVSLTTTEDILVRYHIYFYFLDSRTLVFSPNVAKTHNKGDERIASDVKPFYSIVMYLVKHMLGGVVITLIFFLLTNVSCSFPFSDICIGSPSTLIN